MWSCPTAQTLRAGYLVGCDGGRSLVRKAAGIEFPGWDPTVSSLIAEAEMSEAAGAGHPTRREGYAGDGPAARTDAGRDRRQREVRGAAGQPTLRDLERGAGRGLGNRLRRAQPDLDLAVHGHDPAGRVLPEGACAARGRRRSHPLPGGWAGPQPRRPGRGQPGLETGPGGQRHIAGEPAGHVPHRAAPGGRPRVGEPRWRRPS